MAKKMEKRARILYVEGDKNAGKERWIEGERFRLEIWDNESKSWCLMRQVACTRSEWWPDEKENNFIHWEIMKDLYNLAKEGYSLTWESAEN